MQTFLSHRTYAKTNAKVFIHLLVFLVFTFVNTAFAKPHPTGNIVFIGTTSDGQRSLWLSTTTSGSFEVQARNQTVDQWNMSQNGLHETLSPVVGNGNSGAHSLYQIIDNNPVFLDKDNQAGGIIIPPLSLFLARQRIRSLFLANRHNLLLQQAQHPITPAQLNKVQLQQMYAIPLPLLPDANLICRQNAGMSGLMVIIMISPIRATDLTEVAR